MKMYKANFIKNSIEEFEMNSPTAGTLARNGAEKPIIIERKNAHLFGYFETKAEAKLLLLTRSINEINKTIESLSKRMDDLIAWRNEINKTIKD